MPALWPKFIPELANTIMSQQFTKPGTGLGAPELPVQVSKAGNPVNNALASNPADYVNAFTPGLSGRYDFGKQVAQHYIDAVKNLAMTHVGALHINNPAAELILKEGYGIAFERLLSEGDIPLMDQYDEDGNLIQMGKESHPAYADFCPTEEETKGPDLEALKAENDKAFDEFVDTMKDEYDLHKFKFYQFPCLSGDETQEELEVIFATRILMAYQRITSSNERWNYFVWACHLGGENYNTSNSWNANSNYKNINSKAKNDIEDAGYDYKLLADNVSKYVKDGIMAAHPAKETDIIRTGNNSTLEARIKRTAEEEILFPEFNSSKEGKSITPEFCPINEYKLQVAYDFEEDSQRPKILTSNVVATFTYYPGKKQGGIGGGFVIDNEEGLFVKSGPSNIRFEKSSSWVRQKYEKDEYEKKWIKVPKSKLIAASKKADAKKAFLQINPKPEGTLFKFEYHKTKCAVKAAEKCEEEMAEVDHPWEASGSTPSGKTFSGDPYMMMARVTIAYWYACIVKPFQPVTPAPPALIPPPLTGIYIPIYYGSANRLANNLRRAWNTGKTFNKVPAVQPPAFAVSSAVAGAYALHLLEFKLLYLGGIPTPVGPVPMVGFVPVVF